MYKPTHEELIEMGFTPHEWEGIIYRYDFLAISWHPCRLNGEQYEVGPHWALSSWYQPWFPRTKEDVETVVKCYDPYNPKELIVGKRGLEHLDGTPIENPKLIK